MITSTIVESKRAFAEFFILPNLSNLIDIKLKISEPRISNETRRTRKPGSAGKLGINFLRMEGGVRSKTEILPRTSIRIRRCPLDHSCLIDKEFRRALTENVLPNKKRNVL